MENEFKITVSQDAKEIVLDALIEKRTQLSKNLSELDELILTLKKELGNDSNFSKRHISDYILSYPNDGTWIEKIKTILSFEENGLKVSQITDKIAEIENRTDKKEIRNGVASTLSQKLKKEETFIKEDIGGVSYYKNKKEM